MGVGGAIAAILILKTIPLMLATFKQEIQDERLHQINREADIGKALAKTTSAAAEALLKQNAAVVKALELLADRVNGKLTEQTAILSGRLGEVKTAISCHYPTGDKP